MFVLLIIIYISFISLGLPDSLLGSAWPSMYQSIGVPVANAGYLAMIITGGTIVSSFFSGKVIGKFGTGLTTVVSVMLTAIALLGFSFSGTFLSLCFWAVPLGLGAGSVDAGLNHFVSLHYKAKHMNWLHCFWGIGATLGPVLMSFFLVTYHSWNMGYRAIGLFQVALVILLLLSLGIWKKASVAKTTGNETGVSTLSYSNILTLPGVKQALVAFFCYCALETTGGLWGGSYLVLVRGVSPEAAARWVSLYYLGITFGRFLSGFISIKLNQKSMIYSGQAIIAVALLFFALPLGEVAPFIGLFLVGLGCAPIYPALLHETPRNFGKEHAQIIMGVQMAGAYTGSTLIPPLFGLLGSEFGYQLFPVFLLILLSVMVIATNLLYRRVKRTTAFTKKKEVGDV